MNHMVKLYLPVVLFVAFVALNHAQDQSGFISIDCGVPANSHYTDEKTGLNYVPEADYIDAGVSSSISPLHMTTGLEQQLMNVRSFPEGIKNCYTLTPLQKENQARYFVRACFMYGNYDNKNQLPTFDIYLGVTYWDTVSFVDQSTTVTKEILHDPSSNYTYVCLVNTGNGTPFISGLELRLVDDRIYRSLSNSSLSLSGRYDLRSYDNKEIIRFKDDIIDRMWEPIVDPDSEPSFSQYEFIGLNTSQTVTPIELNNYTLPYVVMSSAVTTKNVNESLDFFWQPVDPNAQYYIYMHFADIQSTQIREFNITLNGQYWYGPMKPTYSALTVFSTGATLTRAAWFNFSMKKTSSSELPPILNALEIYILKDLSNPQTNQQDVDAIKNIKSEYGIKNNWQGDPCAPWSLLWIGLDCFNDTSGTPRISSLKLSANGLTGTISASLEKLNMLQSLDLSDNDLTGELPVFLSQMEKLLVLNLSGNNFTGTIPSELIKRFTTGSLSLSVERNPYLCTSDPCNTTTPEEEKKRSVPVVPVIASIAAVLILFVALAILLLIILRRRKTQQKQGGGTMEIVNREGPFLAKQQQYTYAEVTKITRNFERVLGKGGFGSVFHGSINNTQVAVKMLSPSSFQGYKQFMAEAELLMRVYHRNLTTLVGYCIEGNKLGLVYEHMANGDLERHLSDRNQKILSWQLRLEIAVDAAQGLEYLHTGCKPPIIHRDIKTTNILLNEDFQAKLADFGLSKAFPYEGATHVSTAFAGTPGYFDPEYNLNEKSDVYSFGVVLLEIITGKPPIEMDRDERSHISKWAVQTLETNGDVRYVVDKRLGNDFNLNSVWKALDVAMECVSRSSIQRPTMNQVVIELKGCLEMENKARTSKGGQRESEYAQSSGFNNVKIEISDMTPMPR